MKRTIFGVVLAAQLLASGAPGRGESVRLRQELQTRNLRSDAGLIRTGGGNWIGLSHTDRYGVIVASAMNATSAAREPARALLYSCGTTVPQDSTSGACGVALSDAVAHGWLLKDARGRYVHYKGTGSILTDIGNSAYQQAFVSAIDANLRTHPGIDGVFIDDVTGSLINNTPVSTKYPANASYRAAMLSFMKAVGPALHAKGWYVSVNASIVDGAIESTTGPAWDGSQFIWWCHQLAPYINGVAEEHWQQNWDSSDSVRVSGNVGNQGWDGWQRIVAAVQGDGKDFYAIEEGALDDRKRATYLRASFLLASRPGRGAFFYVDRYDGRGDPWTRVANPGIGRPVARATRVGVGFKRTFARGIVAVNPNPSESQTFVLGRSYLMPGGGTAAAVRIPPGTAVILPRPAHR